MYKSLVSRIISEILAEGYLSMGLVDVVVIFQYVIKHQTIFLSHRVAGEVSGVTW